MITDKDVAEGLLTKWGATAALTALAPLARVYTDRVAERSEWPNGKVVVKEGETTRMGSANYLRTFEAEIVVELQGIVIDPDAVRAQLTATFGGTFADWTAGLTVPGGTVLHSLEKAGGTSPKAGKLGRRGGQDFLRVASEFDILVQGAD